MANETSEHTAQTGVENETLENEDVEVDGEQLDDDTRKKVETLTHQKKHWREQAIDPETGKKWKDIVQEQRQQKSESPKQEDPNDDDDFDQMLKVTKSVQDLTDDELTELDKLSAELGVPKKTLVTTSAWEARKAQLRAQQEEDKAVPDTSRRASSAPTKSWADMTKAERKAAFPQQTEKHRRRE